MRQSVRMRNFCIESYNYFSLPQSELHMQDKYKISGQLLAASAP